MELIVALLLLILVGYPVYRKLRRASQISPDLDDHNLNSINPETDALAFAGQSEFRTDSFDLESGTYKLLYWFPEAVMVKVELYSAGGDDHETLVMKRGTGEVSISVEKGRYFCVIEPAEEPAEWEIEISRLGLPSQKAAL